MAADLPRHRSSPYAQRRGPFLFRSEKHRPVGEVGALAAQGCLREVARGDECVAIAREHLAKRMSAANKWVRLLRLAMRRSVRQRGQVLARGLKEKRESEMKAIATPLFKIVGLGAPEVKGFFASLGERFFGRKDKGIEDLGKVLRGRVEEYAKQAARSDAQVEAQRKLNDDLLCEKDQAEKQAAANGKLAEKLAAEKGALETECVDAKDWIQRLVQGNRTLEKQVADKDAVIVCLKNEKKELLERIAKLTNMHGIESV
mmetsp:Transcript_7203/g.13944  ORF Transcript_7203/g.13944 Transcript_7203/m.13944 type:complete len:259 (-) Transcript_7203:254-1030(-)